MGVEPDVSLICLGDMNGRLKSLEPHLETDSNGKMVEKRTEKYNLHHLNQSEKCIELYTFSKKGGKVENCLFMLHYIANMTFESTRQELKKLVFTFIDFQKALREFNT